MKVLRPVDRAPRRPLLHADAFECVLRKHGVVAVSTVEEAGPEDHGVAVGGAVPPDGDGPWLVDGPLTDAQLRVLGLGRGVEVRAGAGLRFEDGPRGLHPDYSSILVRTVPRKGHPTEDPSPFSSDDPAWAAPTFAGHALALPSDGGWRPVAWVDDAVVAAEREGRLVFGLPVLDLIAHEHGIPPLDRGFFTVDRGARSEPIEDWLVARWLDMVARRRPLAIVHPWPSGRRACFTIRHDFDRAIPDESIRALLEAYAARGVRSTWFWRIGRLQPEQMRMVTEAGHEVALHTEANDEAAFREELDRFEEAVGHPALGYSAHGGHPGPGYIGMHQLDWAARAGLLYGEMLGRDARWPHAAIRVIEEDGRLGLDPLIVPAVHRSLDRSTKDGDHHRDELPGILGPMLDAGRQVVLMNHPDLHREALLGLLDELAADGSFDRVWHATLADAARRARAITVAARAGLAAGRTSEQIRIRFAEPPVEPVEIEWRGPGEPGQTGTVPAGSLGAVAGAGAIESLSPESARLHDTRTPLVGPVAALVRDVREIVRRRELIRFMAGRGLGGGLADTFLGPLWNVISPMVQVAVYFVVVNFIFSRGASASAVFATIVTGLMHWMFLSGAVTSATGSILGRASLLRQVPLSPVVIVAARFREHLSHLAVRLGILAVLLLLVGVPLRASMFAWPLVVVLLVAYGWTLSLLAATITIHFRDLKQIASHGMLMLMYLSPVIYGLDFVDKTVAGIHLKTLMLLNPLAGVMAGAKWSLLGEPAPPAWAIAWSVFVVAGLALAAHGLHERLGRRITKVM